MFTGSSRTTTIDAPTETPTPTQAPSVWDMPDTSAGVCDCGGNCTTNREVVLEVAHHLGFDKKWLLHDEIIDMAMELWAYEAVCEFFLMVINDSAKAVNGEVANRYPFERGIEIVGYFSKTWQGCPDDTCRTVREFGEY